MHDMLSVIVKQEEENIKIGLDLLIWVPNEYKIRLNGVNRVKMYKVGLKGSNVLKNA